MIVGFQQYTLPAVAAPDAGLDQATSVTPPVVVNELNGGNFVELRNVSANTIHIGAYNLWLCDANGVARTLRVALGAQLAPGDHYLVASAYYTGAQADQTYPDRLPSGGALLLDPWYHWVDGAAVVADSPCGQGDPAPPCPDASSARDGSGLHTGDNAVDFSCRWPTPGYLN